MAQAVLHPAGLLLRGGIRHHRRPSYSTHVRAAALGPAKVALGHPDAPGLGGATVLAVSEPSFGAQCGGRRGRGAAPRALMPRGTSCHAAATSTAQAFVLSREEKAQFEEQGFLVLPGFASAEECQELQARMQQLLQHFDLSDVSVFSSRNQNNVANDYFLRSGGNISFFFEENAFDEAGNLKQPKDLSINKVGHALHDLDPVFRSFSRSARMASLLRELGLRRPLPVQSMYIFKQPGIGGEVVPHQDSSFLYTDPPSCVGLWLAVEDATEENGCLWALPGSHKGDLARRFVKTEDGKLTFDKPEGSYDVTEFIPLPVPRGSLVVLHGALVHFSYENKSPVSRHAYTVHMIETDGCTYAADNWLQRQAEDPPFEPLLSA